MSFNIDELLAYFIEINYNEEKKCDIYTSLSLFNLFSLKYYDSELVSYLMNDDLMDTNELRDFVYEFIKNKVIFIIKSHSINLQYENNITLNELNEIANFLYLIQNIENYEQAHYILSAARYSDEDNRNIFINLISYYTIIDKVRLNEIIGAVKEEFLDSLIRYVEERVKDLNNKIDLNYIRNFNYFIEFTNNYDTIGKRLFESGYKNINLLDLVNLTNTNFNDLYAENITNMPLFALNCLSVLLLAKDTYENPILFFNKNMDIFLENKDKSMIIVEIMRKILIDFNDFAKHKLEGYEKVEETKNEET